MMDFILIALVNWICKYAATFWRILISATLGAVWSVIAVMMPERLKILEMLCTYVLISFSMVRICAGKCQFRDLLKGVVTLFTVAFMLGGMMHFLYYNTYAGYFIKQMIVRDSSLILFIAVSLILLALIYTQLARIKVYSDKKCRICCVIMGKEVTLQGYIDTGNVLSDPYVHRPVSVAEKEVFSSVLNEINDCTKVKYHLVPFRSLGCADGMLEVITVDTMYIYTGGKKKIFHQALVGLTKTTLSSDGEYQMLVNSQLLV